MGGKSKGAALRWRGTMLQHPGCVRTVNEDAVAYVIPGENDPHAPRGALALVADGMGGHAAGDVASRIASDTVVRLYYELEGSPPEVLTTCLAAANKAIYDHGEANRECRGMGTTCTVLATRQGLAYLGHVGDSRAYLLRAGELHQISQDHSLVAELVRAGTLTKEEAARSPERNIIVRALGTEPIVEPSVWSKGLPLQAGDVFVLCSDGLSDIVPDSMIRQIAANRVPFAACEALIDAALQAGATDNVSVGVFAVVSDQQQLVAARVTRPIDLPGNPA
jgi:PPM family protein phosphatase